MDIADVAAAEPRGLVGADTSQGKLRLMAADGVVGQRRAFSGQRNDLSERNKTKLDERLESVADTYHQTVAGIEHFLNGVLDLRVAEERVDELCGALRLVAAAESAGDHDDLRLARHSGKGDNGIFHCRSGKVPDDKGLGSCAGTLKDTCGVVFAVCAGEYGNEHFRTGKFFA